MLLVARMAPPQLKWSKGVKLNAILEHVKLNGTLFGVSFCQKRTPYISSFLESARAAISLIGSITPES
jgi:hypothetical protein